MIKYDLRCARDHQFEGWFGSMGDYEDQVESGLLVCPECGTKKVEKAIMAPSVRTSNKMEALAEAIRNEIATTCDDVGEDFTSEARAMFYGEKPTRGIYGKATSQQTKDMIEDGIPALPIPDMLNPKRMKKKLN